MKVFMKTRFVRALRLNRDPEGFLIKADSIQSPPLVIVLEYGAPSLISESFGSNAFQRPFNARFFFVHFRLSAGLQRQTFDDNTGSQGHF